MVVKTASGVEVEIGRVNQEAFASEGDEASGHSLRGVCLPLHYRHRFTRAASVDGSAEDPRRHGGEKRKRVAYGVYEGVLHEAEVQAPPEGWDALTEEQRALRCLKAAGWVWACSSTSGATSWGRWLRRGAATAANRTWQV